MSSDSQELQPSSITAGKILEDATWTGFSSRFMLVEGIEKCPIPMFVIDHEHVVTSWNLALANLTGLTGAEMVGTRNQWKGAYDAERSTLADLIIDGALEREVDACYHGKYKRSSLLESGVEVCDFFPRLGEDGRWLFFTAAPLRDAKDNLIGVIETLQDITEQKIAEQALRESEEKYKTMSITDALTSLFNSRRFYEQIGIETTRARRYGRALSLILFDLDNFKKINDVHGHIEGDRVLAAVAGVVANNLRSMDSAYRYGGEEFTLLLPETGIESAAILAERLRQSIADISLTTSSGAAIAVTASIGVAEYASPEIAQSFVRRADDGVYEAKRKGKNRVFANTIVTE